MVGASAGYPVAPVAPRDSRLAAWSNAAGHVSTRSPPMREGRVPSGPCYEERGSRPRADATSRSASTSQQLGRDAKTDGGARSGASRSKLRSPPTSWGAVPWRATYRVPWCQKTRLRASWEQAPYDVWACRESDLRPRPTKT